MFCLSCFFAAMAQSYLLDTGLKMNEPSDDSKIIWKSEEAEKKTPICLLMKLRLKLTRKFQGIHKEASRLKEVRIITKTLPLPCQFSVKFLNPLFTILF